MAQIIWPWDWKMDMLYSASILAQVIIIFRIVLNLSVQETKHSLWIVCGSNHIIHVTFTELHNKQASTKEYGVLNPMENTKYTSIWYFMLLSFLRPSWHPQSWAAGPQLGCAYTACGPTAHPGLATGGHTGQHNRQLSGQAGRTEPSLPAVCGWPWPLPASHAAWQYGHTSNIYRSSHPSCTYISQFVKMFFTWNPPISYTIVVWISNMFIFIRICRLIKDTL